MTRCQKCSAKSGRFTLAYDRTGTVLGCIKCVSVLDGTPLPTETNTEGMQWSDFMNTFRSVHSMTGQKVG